MRGDGVVAEPLGQVPRRALREPARVDEHERRAMRANELGEPVVLLDPNLGGHDRLERRARQLEREIALARVAFVDDRAGRIGNAREKAGQHVDRLRRRRNADARRRPLAERFEPFQRQRQMRAALVARERVDFVDDDRAHRAQHVPARLGAEQDVQRLRRRDENVRRLAAHARAFALRRVARAHGRPDRRIAEHACGELAADALERRAQVLLDVVRQRLERRHVENLRLVAQRARGGLLGEQIDDAEERGERLARARGRADQRVRACADRVPGFELHARRRRESAAEPAGDGRVEGLGEHGLDLPKNLVLCPVL